MEQRPHGFPFAATAKWARAQMLKMDWPLRHHHLNVFSVTRPMLFRAIVNQLTPDECLWSTSSCPTLLPSTVIIARDIDRNHRYKQIKLDNYFVKRRAS